ncbi:MAG: hypothetical protein SGJ20_10520 [Planctomycetota bacterium]|nr:hypothetical protein [Planctomycetota bacterium]
MAKLSDLASFPRPLRRRCALVAGIIAIMLGGLWWGASTLQPASDAQTILSQVASTPDADVRPTLSRLVPLGQPGVTALVQCLRSDRAMVRDCAAALLHEQLDRCLAVEGKTAPLLNHLANAICDQMTNPASKPTAATLRHAAQLADRILHATVISSESTASINDKSIEQRIQCCQTIFDCRRAKAAEFRPVDPAVQKTPFGQDPLSPSTDQLSPDIVASQPGGGLPLPTIADSPRLHGESGTASSRLATSADSTKSNPSGSSSSAQKASHTEPARLKSSNTSAATRSANRAPGPGGNALTEQNAFYTTQVDVPSNTAARLQPPAAIPVGLTALLDLANRAASKSPLIAKVAHQQISKAGVSTAHLELARGAVAADPSVRKDVVEALPFVAGLDTSAWLAWLSYDKDATVRRAALSLMATRTDPASQKRLIEAAAADADEQIRAMASHATKKHTSRRERISE